jgi:hypothetical protein
MKNDKKNSFEEANTEEQPGVVSEFFQMLMHNKKYWLIPIVLILGIFGLLIFLGGSAAAPFIYTLF